MNDKSDIVGQKLRGAITELMLICPVIPQRTFPGCLEEMNDRKALPMPRDIFGLKYILNCFLECNIKQSFKPLMKYISF